ncbi:MAG TPA: hypothetical protein VMU95_00070 [Trebonia sp.]|nr:hypothetical protein [Trebonia sp.]
MAYQGAESQNDAFGAGVSHQVNEDRFNGGSLSLAQAGESFTSQVSSGLGRPHSVLQSLGANPGGLGMSAEDAANRMPDGTWMGAQNGVSQESYEPTKMLRLVATDQGELS